MMYNDHSLVESFTGKYFKFNEGALMITQATVIIQATIYGAESDDVPNVENQNQQNFALDFDGVDDYRNSYWSLNLEWLFCIHCTIKHIQHAFRKSYDLGFIKQYMEFLLAVD